MSLKEDIEEVKHEIEELEKESFAMEILKDLKKQNKRLFIIWIITFVILAAVTCYTIYLIGDTGTIEETQTIKDIDTIENSNINNGGGK